MATESRRVTHRSAMAKPTEREAQRLLTRQRVLDAAIVEFSRTGTAAADIKAVVSTAGVSRSTFYFHFPTKEHVLLELIRREEARVADEFGRFLDEPHDVPAVLYELVRLVVDLESRWGGLLFRDVIGLYFSATRPEDDEWTDHPTIVLLAAELLRARTRREVADDVDAFHSAVFFLLGLYALLCALRDATDARDSLLTTYVTNTLRSLHPTPN